MTKKLVLSDGTRERELHLVGRIVVGRDPACEISHDDSLLSRRHAEFVTSGNTVTVRDLGSRNGVFVNGARASEQALEPGDVVQIGPLRARFVVDSAPRSMSPEALDVDRTAVIRKVSPPPPPVPVAPVHPAVALAFEEVDEDATRLVIEPRPSASASASASGSASVSESAPLFMRPEEFPAEDDEDEDVTRFKAAPEIPALRPVLRKVELPVKVAPVAPPVAPPRAAAPAPAVNTLGTFVYGQLLTLVLAVLGATSVALVMWRRSLGPESIAASTSSLAWFALPVAAAIAGTFVIGAAINRRIAAALAQNDRSRT